MNEAQFQKWRIKYFSSFGFQTPVLIDFLREAYKEAHNDGVNQELDNWKPFDNWNSEHDNNIHS